MTIRYHITPYDHKIYKDEKSEKEFDFSTINLIVNMKNMVVQANQVFSIETGGDVATLKSDGRDSLYFFITGENILSIEIAMGGNFSSFIKWYRDYIESTNELFLFREGSWESLKLEEDTTVDEIIAWTGLH